MEREQLTAHFTRTWLYNRQVAIFDSRSPNRDEIDLFANTFLQTCIEWPQGTPIRVLVDLTHAPFSPYSQKRMSEMVSQFPTQIQGRMAALLPGTVLGQVMRAFAKRLTLGRTLSFEMSYFTSRDEAMAWLEEGLQK